MEWVYKKWATLQDEYSQIPDLLRQYYVDELAKAMADGSVCGFKIEGDDNLNVDTVWLHLFTD
ncbi:hypothetical protein [Spirosoma oryzae]|uniref:hypothetical protein n=1 Tax=Spirosoma oryzae TaxID=1469603 RepID=UPI000D07F86E|nr:hypothetical protein [Spirosoma oryzae]